MISSVLPITICFTYFRSLTLANLAASLASVRQQDFTNVESLVIVDNNTDDSEASIRDVIDQLDFPIPVRLFSLKHGDKTKTHCYSTNIAVGVAWTPWVFFCRADYLLDFDAVSNLSAEMGANRFIVGGYYDVSLDVHRCEQTSWRQHGPQVLRPYGREYDHVTIDSGVWMTRRDIFEAAGGMDESMSAWGHAQTVFQYKVHQLGVDIVRVPSIIFYHTAHGYETPRDHGEASRQLNGLGLNLQEMWSRYSGPDNPYR